jgi:hypothetical protein
LASTRFFFSCSWPSPASSLSPPPSSSNDTTRPTIRSVADVWEAEGVSRLTHPVVRWWVLGKELHSWHGWRVPVITAMPLLPPLSEFPC